MNILEVRTMAYGCGIRGGVGMAMIPRWWKGWVMEGRWRKGCPFSSSSSPFRLWFNWGSAIIRET